MKKGKEIDEDELQELSSEDDFIKCKSQALKIIEKTHKTEKQIVDKLLLKEYDEKIIDKTIIFLKQYNFVNDLKYVQMYVKDKSSLQGKNKIKYDLIKKGIDEEIIEEELGKVNGEQEIQVAEKLIEKKYNILCKSERDVNKIKKKLADFIQRKGYKYSLVKNIIERIVTEQEEEKSDLKEEIDYEEEYRKLYEIASKRYELLSKREDNNAKLNKKMWDFLMRKGYGSDDIKRVIRDIIENK